MLSDVQCGGHGLGEVLVLIEVKMAWHGHSKSYQVFNAPSGSREVRVYESSNGLARPS